MAIEGMRSYDDFCHDVGEDEPAEHDERENADALDEEERYRLAEYIRTLSGVERMRLQVWVKKRQDAIAKPASYSETFRDIENLVPETTSFCLSIETWAHVREDGSRERTGPKWRLSTLEGSHVTSHVEAATPEALIEAFKADNAADMSVDEVEL